MVLKCDFLFVTPSPFWAHWIWFEIGSWQMQYNSNCELDQQQQGDFLEQIMLKVVTELQGAGSIELRLNSTTIAIISIHVGDPYNALLEQ